MENEQKNYYPFGLQHGSYNKLSRDYGSIGDAIEIETVDRNPYKYKYNSKEWQDELGLGWYDYGARKYDASSGRWMNVDPLGEKYPNISSSSHDFTVDGRQNRWITTSMGATWGMRANAGSAGIRYSNTRLGVGFEGRFRFANYLQSIQKPVINPIKP
ncbi:hypothetical protein NLM59_04415 [Weeksellaceae bacterium KMM 9724]|uniref:RHS repeat-associated core domain-containing protein n=1 Tax=Profundicola chukchiensis TaxID=2961959 RepID=UPI00243DA0C1|nr:RHS repeat-associated core domain-containing protein [Profundicola chukchiensis]MDG4950157.1 hypothetical protein [Profundicola chukchiensis]